ncbi:anion transporter [Chryseobacterium elymi]|uniref:Anion transporter n=1 Tax=Chryseobacterium elymi TaxID=395936 RepID=A0A3D9DMV3_9FLAO|nr:DASS family sodium-coupled anion symporter [Chryseobacterium elymi]REC79289.1 anion transporter [Chryseobacterium elymi]
MPTYYKIHRKKIGLIIGFLLSVLCCITNPFALSHHANQVLSVAVLMIVWWIFEAVPMAVTALIPLVLFPSFGISSIKKVAESYADPIVFLFMGGFFIAIAIEKWNLHKRIALGIIGITGTNGNRIILGFIMATGFLSLWLSNTATTIMMYPLAVSVIHVVQNHNKSEKNTQNFSLALLLSIAYASNFALGTVIATPPNVAYVGYIKDRFNYTIGFSDWMVLFLPLTLVLLLMLYGVLVKIMYPNNIQHNNEASNTIKKAQFQLGTISRPELRVLLIFIFTVLLWISKDLVNKWQTFLKLDDTVIALLSAILLFLIPSGNKKNRKPERLLVWRDTQKMAWDILLLFGGGIALANALEVSQLANEFANGLAYITTGNLLLVIIIISAISIFLSEVISNLALVMILSPVVTTLALSLHIDPLLLGIPMTLSASCSSMLPMGTPPNAIIFARGNIKIQTMMKTGFVLNIICIIIISLVCWFFIPMMPGMKL